LLDNVEKCGAAGQPTDDTILWRMRFACWITKGANTQSEYVILIAFQRQQLFRERASVQCYTYIACLVYTLLTISSHLPSIVTYIKLLPISLSVFTQ